jgi:hypothetical protein
MGAILPGAATDITRANLSPLWIALDISFFEQVPEELLIFRTKQLYIFMVLGWSGGEDITSSLSVEEWHI